jgi:hypothetical protein
MLLAGIGCQSVHSGNRMMSFGPDRQSKRYHGDNNLTNSIIGIVKDEDNKPVLLAKVELYVGDERVVPLLATTTSQRGKFSFTVSPGAYAILITSQKFKEEWISVFVNGSADVDLNEIHLMGFFN